MTQLRISSGGREFIAETHPDAPQTVTAFLKLSAVPPETDPRPVERRRLLGAPR